MIINGNEVSLPSPKAPVIRLHKYVSNIALLGLVSNGELKVSYGHEANDPFEMQPKGYIPGQYENVDNVGFISASRKDYSSFMWGCYAEGFRGARLSFSIPYFDRVSTKEERVRTLVQVCRNGSGQSVNTQLVAHCNMERGKGINADRIEDKLWPCYVGECIYNNERCDPKKQYGGNIDTRLLTYIRIMERLLTKHNDWAHEKESRILIFPGAITRCDYTENPKAFTTLASPWVDSILLGPRSPLTATDVRIMLGQSRFWQESGRKIPRVSKAEYSADDYSLVE